ncbi:hypothetical protein [Loigolactobacillus zhaoyuanensis]|uniref:DUF5082 domain-containing protein n=1 Tax=Loigolactobacillus zhaoyuanensis TaxID=2486017 RepID=A0ABW8UC47_9LACO|nr:hypothetical protein [Loigolactobacillus zhaoyuanensis]
MAVDKVADIEKIKARLEKLAADMRKLGGKTGSLSQNWTQAQAIREVNAIVSATQAVTANSQPLTTAERKGLEYIETEFINLDDALVNLSDNNIKLKQAMLKKQALTAVQQRLTLK